MLKKQYYLIFSSWPNIGLETLHFFFHILQAWNRTTCTWRETNNNNNNKQTNKQSLKGNNIGWFYSNNPKGRGFTIVWVSKNGDFKKEMIGMNPLSTSQKKWNYNKILMLWEKSIFSKVHQGIPEESTDYLGILNKTENEKQWNNNNCFPTLFVTLPTLTETRDVAYLLWNMLVVYSLNY